MIRPRRKYRKLPLPAIDWRFYLSLITALFFAANLNYLLVTLRDLGSYGFITGSAWHYTEIPTAKRYLYDVYIALISTFAGFGMFTNMWINPKWSIPGKVKSSASLDQHYLSGYFLFLGLKFAVFLISFEADIDWLSELWPLLLFSPVVLFFQQWSEYRRRFRGISNRLVVRTAAFQLAFALIVAAIPIHNREAMESVARNHTPTAALELQVPSSEMSTVIYRHSLSVDMQIANRRGDKELFIGLGQFLNEPTPVDQIRAKLRMKRDTLLENEQSALTVVLYADGQLSANVILDVLHEMRYDAGLNVLLATHPKRAAGLPLHFPRFCPDILKRLGVEPESDVPEPPSFACMVSDQNLGLMNLSVLSLRNNKLYLNDSLISKAQLKQWSGRKILEQHNRADHSSGLYLTVDESSTYQALVDIVDASYGALYELRSAMVKDKFGVQYDPYESPYDVKEFASEIRGIPLIIHSRLEAEMYRERYLKPARK